MIYGTILENKKMNKTIYDCFDLLPEREQKRYVKKFKEQPHNEDQFIHTFRELILGAFLSANGFIVESERQIGKQKPDWSIINNSLEVIAIVEMFHHHIDHKTKDHILAQHTTGKNGISYFPNGNDPEHDRLYKTIQGKTCKYKNLVAIKIPFVVAISIDTFVLIDPQKTKDCLMSGDEPLFKLYPYLSGVLHFEEGNNPGSYKFSYIENPFALCKIDIPSGVFGERLG